jgi:serine/threonine-protein kinase
MRSRVVTAVACLAVGIAAPAAGQTRDHLACYRIDDPLAVKGLVNVTAPRTGLEAGCKLGRAKLLCDPARKTVVRSNVPVLPVGGRGLLDSRICYRLRCPQPFPGDQGVADQFGTRAVAKLRPRLLCTPAVEGPPATPMDGLDDVKCYRESDPVKLRGVVDVDPLDFAPHAGCGIKRSKLLCVPASTTLLQINVGPLLPIGGTDPDDARVCYTLACGTTTLAPHVVSDRLGSRTVTGLKPSLLCAPSPVSADTTTTTTSTTVTTTSFPPGTDPGLVCQRAIETGGLAYADAVLDRIAACAGSSGQTPLTDCLASNAVSQALDAVRTQWTTTVGTSCNGLDLQIDLGYPEVCGAAPSLCTFPSAGLDAPGPSNDVLDCLACRIEEQLRTSATSLYANLGATEPCRQSLGDGASQVLRSTLQQLASCVQQSGLHSVAGCFAPDVTAWRSQAQTSCAGVDPYATLGYSSFCSGVPAVSPNSYAPHALPCSFNTMALNVSGVDNDLLDCLACQTGEGVLGVARDLFGANLCCIGGTCNKVLTRFACREAAGTPVRYRVDSVPGLPITFAHGIEVGPDGSLYVADDSSNRILKRTPAGVVTTVGSPSSFPTGVAADVAGNVYVTNRCQHRVTKFDPAGVPTVIAGTGTAGSTGDGGPAIAAQIVAPDGIAVDPAGNVYFTESGLLGFVCGTLLGSERVRMVDTAGNIHTLVGGSVGGSGGEGGPGTLAQLLGTYGLHRAFDGTLLIGEVGAQRVVRLDAAGNVSRVAGEPISPVGHHAGYGGPAATARFYQNCGAAGDPDGNVLISPMEDNRIALVDTLGSVIAIAGTGEGAVGPTVGAPAGDGGPGMLAVVGLPEDVAVGPDGRVYFSDLLTGRVRVLTREPF